MASLNDISSNSDDARENAPDVEETYEPLKKVSIFGKILSAFGIESDMGGALGTVWEDVIKPTFLDGCRDSMYSLADYFFGGSGASSSRGRSSSKKGEKHTNYSNKFRTRPNRGKAPSSAAYYIPHEDKYWVLDRLNDMWDVVGQCDFCSIQDCIVIFGKKPSDNYMLQDWGWYASDLNNVRAKRNEEGLWYLDLPRPKPKEDK